MPWERVEMEGLTAELDFLVIGAQKAGTTSLWQYLRLNPRISMPASKEAPLFSMGWPAPEPADAAAALNAIFAETPADALRATVTPDYMVGEQGVPPPEIAARIAAVVPNVKLIALLRDPIARALSSYRMAVRRGQEARAVEDAFDSLLVAEEIAAARRVPSPTNSYLVAGEYGRILAAYRSCFPADRLMTAFTADLERDPGVVIDSVLDFVSLPTGFRPPGLHRRHFRGGTEKLLDPQAEAELRDFLNSEILPQVRGSVTQHRRAIDFFLETWNVKPSRPPTLSEPLRQRLRDHFRADAERLFELGIASPWLGRWDCDL